MINKMKKVKVLTASLSAFVLGIGISQNACGTNQTPPALIAVQNPVTLTAAKYIRVPANVHQAYMNNNRNAMLDFIGKKLDKCCNNASVQNFLEGVRNSTGGGTRKSNLRDILNTHPLVNVNFNRGSVDNFLEHSSRHFMGANNQETPTGRLMASTSVLAAHGNLLRYYYTLHTLDTDRAFVFNWKTAGNWTDENGNLHQHEGLLDIVVPRKEATMYWNNAPMWYIPTDQYDSDKEQIDNIVNKYKAERARGRWIIPAKRCEHDGVLDEAIAGCEKARKIVHNHRVAWAIPVPHKLDVAAAYAPRGHSHATEKLENFPALLIRFLLVREDQELHWIPASMYVPYNNSTN